MDKAVFVDRDGTLGPDIPYLDAPERLELFGCTPDAIRRLREAGFKVVVITNQSGIGRGYFSLETLDSIHRRLREMLKERDADYDALYFCPHKPEERCMCRKPMTGMIDRAVRELGISLDDSYLVGDDAVDVQLARNCGLRSVLVMTGHGAEARRISSPDAVVDDLGKAVDWILKDSEENG
jgi:heptosyltransferase-2